MSYYVVYFIAFIYPHSCQQTTESYHRNIINIVTFIILYYGMWYMSLKLHLSITRKTVPV